MLKNVITFSTEPLKNCYTDIEGHTYCTRDFVNIAEGNKRLARLIFDACEGKSLENTVEDLILIKRLGRCEKCNKIFLAKKSRTCPFCKKNRMLQASYVSGVAVEAAGLIKGLKDSNVI